MRRTLLSVTRHAFLIFVAQGALLACGNHPGTEAETTTELGELTLALSAELDGKEYRLRDAEFTTYRYFYYPAEDGGAPRTQTLSSETDPEAPTVTALLAPGDHRVTLETGWHLEELAPGEAPKRVDAVLLSDASTWVYVRNNRRQTLTYDFGLGNSILQFRAGELNIGIHVEKPCPEGPLGCQNSAVDAGPTDVPSFDAGLNE